MSLDAGHRLGAYEILSPLGAGGMGEVYRARDTRLGRDVAIKVLPADRLTDESRRRRFVQEARAASALNHPNIVTIYEIESADGADFMVMEYVPGKTLDALMRPRIRLSETLRIAIPIADALARAHVAGIVHRDLKPANVVVTPEGVVKLLDFGLAKLMAREEASDEQDTLTEESSRRFVSGPGTIAGTPGYMSPEQATGGKVDARSDIFAFGSLLYEMVTGQRAFARGSRAETLAAVVGAQPKAPSEIAPDLPKDLEKLILRCLRKEPDRRFHHMADVKVELQEISEESDSRWARLAGGVFRGKGVRRLAAVLAVGLALAAAAWRLRSTGDSALPPARVVPLTTMGGSEWTPALSPDGQQIAFSWEGEVASAGAAPNRDIWLTLVGASEARRLTTDAAGDSFPSWSPDGRQIAFIRSTSPPDPFSISQRITGEIHIVSPLGGADRRLSDAPAALSQLSWSPDGRWLAAALVTKEGGQTSRIHLVPAQGGEPQAITAPTPPGYDVHPVFSPEGRRLAYASCGGGIFPPCEVSVLDLGVDFRPQASPRRRFMGKARWTISGLAWTRDGRSLVFSTHYGGVDHYLWRLGAEGVSPPERVELAGRGAFYPATVASTDRLVFTRDLWNEDIYRFEAGRPATAVVVSSFPDRTPSFSPDGRRIAFESGRSGEVQEIWLAQADGSNPVQLTHGPGDWQGTPRWSPDGRRIVFDSRGEDGYRDVWWIDVGGGPPRRLTSGPQHEGLASWSRDGRWIYYRQDRSDGHDIWRVPSAGGPAERLTRNGGLLARESADGKTLFYTQRDETSPLVSLPLAGGPERPVVDCVLSRSLADGPDGMYYLGCSPELREAPLYRLDRATGRSRLLGKVETGRGLRHLAVSPDGKTILFTRMVAEGADLMLIENFR